MIYYPSRSTTLQNFSPIAQTVYEICITKVFQFLAPGGLTLGQSSPKGEMTWRTPRSTVLQNFIALFQSTPEISVTKNPADRKTNKQTVNDISPTCLSACVDNNITYRKDDTSILAEMLKQFYSQFVKGAHVWIKDALTRSG